MPQAQVIDGKAAAEKLRATLGSIVKRLKKDHNLIPGLAVQLATSTQKIKLNRR